MSKNPSAMTLAAVAAKTQRIPGRSRKGIITRSILEPLCVAVGFTTAASGVLLPAGIIKRGGVDRSGSDGAGNEGGITLVDGDVNFEGGLVPSDIGYRLHGMTARVHKLDFSAVCSAAEVELLGENVLLTLKVSGQRYRIGKLAQWLGPYGAPTGLNNVTFPRRFGWAWMADDEAKPVVLKPGKPFSIEAKTLRDQSAILTASKTYVIDFEFQSEVLLANDAALKQ